MSFTQIGIYIFALFLFRLLVFGVFVPFIYNINISLYRRILNEKKNKQKFLKIRRKDQCIMSAAFDLFCRQLLANILLVVVVVAVAVAVAVCLCLCAWAHTYHM